jgi:predicted metal-dependent phosphotriesterase family hydrolase
MTVMTVRGPIDAGELGFTLPHEHLLSDTLIEYRGNGFMRDEALAIAELARFKEAGGASLVDLTTSEIGRDPLALRRISEATGVHVVMSTGHYRDPYLDREWFDRTSVDAIAEEMVRDATEGVGETGVRCGIIGEIGADKWYVSAAEERSLRAAARASLRTGLTINTHACRWPVGLAQLDLLEHEGVDPRRVVVSHVDTVPTPGYALALARRGCWVEFDGFGTDTEYDMTRAIATMRELADAGHFNQLLVSHDVFLRSHLHAFGGNGYDFVARELAARLGEAGFTDDEFRSLTVTHPRRALSGE